MTDIITSKNTFSALTEALESVYLNENFDGKLSALGQKLKPIADQCPPELEEKFASRVQSRLMSVQEEAANRLTNLYQQKGESTFLGEGVINEIIRALRDLAERFSDIVTEITEYVNANMMEDTVEEGTKTKSALFFLWALVALVCYGMIVNASGGVIQSGNVFTDVIFFILNALVNLFSSVMTGPIVIFVFALAFVAMFFLAYTMFDNEDGGGRSSSKKRKKSYT